MKYARYILIAFFLFLLGSSIYAYASPNLVVSTSAGGEDMGLAADDRIIALYRSTMLPWIAVIGTILSGWVFFFKRRFACGAAITSILLIGYIVWKDLAAWPGTMQQAVTAVEHDLVYSLNWMTAFYLLAAVMLLLPIIKKEEQGAAGKALTVE